MSEFWVSKKKYWCRYCECFIADDKPSRTQHESGLRHQGNKERYVRQIYKTGEKRKRDLEEEKREMVAVDRAAQSAFALDVAAGRGGVSSLHNAASTSRQPGASSSKPKPPTSKFANYSTAASLGYIDEDAERAKLLAEQRSKEGTVGAWQVVVPPPPPLPKPDDIKTVGGGDEAEVDVKPPHSNESTSVDEDDTRTFKVRQKKAPFIGKGIGTLYDPGEIIIKKKKIEKVETELPPPSTKTEGEIAVGSSKLPEELRSKEDKGGWRALEEEEIKPPQSRQMDGQPPPESLSADSQEVNQPTEAMPKAEEAEVPIQPTRETLVKAEPTSEPPLIAGPLFKPRKVKRPITSGTSRHGGRF